MTKILIKIIFYFGSFIVGLCTLILAGAITYLLTFHTANVMSTLIIFLFIVIIIFVSTALGMAIINDSQQYLKKLFNRQEEN